jgi:hypothetical protein
VLLPPAFGVAVPTQGADAGIHIFNGDGTGTDTVTFRIGNNFVLEDVVSPLLYTALPQFWCLEGDGVFQQFFRISQATTRQFNICVKWSGFSWIHLL